MPDQLPGFRTSSARRGKWRPSLVTTSVVVVVVIFVFLAIRNRDRRMPVDAASPTPAVRPTTPPSPTASALPTEIIERNSDWITVTVPTATPTPWPTLPPPADATPRREATPTPPASRCVVLRWSARQVFSPSAQVLVEIEAVNRCRRDFGPLELWFEITGWRRGDRVQTVRGHPFDRIRSGRSGIVAIGLPGSLDWYDEITVEIVE